MTDNEKGIKIRILDREFKIGCSKESIPALQEAASYLDKQMRDIRQATRLVDLEKIAIMAALNISNEFVALKKTAPDEEEVRRLQGRLHAMQDKIDKALLNPPNTPFTQVVMPRSGTNRADDESYDETGY